MSRDDLAAAILVGGQSRRMGENKAFLKLDPSGPTVVETVARKLKQISTDVMLVGSRDPAYACLGLPQIGDHMPGTGALGGIHAALASTSRSHLLVVACDMPLLNLDLLQYMAALPRNYDVLVPVVDRPQPLHAIYARRCLPLIERSLENGNCKVTGWYAQVRVRLIESSTIQRFDPSLRSCFNMNTPADVALATQVLARGQTNSLASGTGIYTRMDADTPLD